MDFDGTAVAGLLLILLLVALGLGLHRSRVDLRRLEADLAARALQLELSQRDLAERALQLEHSEREIQEFARIASHDLQEPLRKARAFGDLLRLHCQGDVDEEGRDYLARMMASMERMQELLDDLLDLFRVTSRAGPFVPTPLAQAAREAVARLEGQIQETGGRVEVDDLPTVEADPLQMRLLLQHLVGNGLKFHREGVPPQVRVSGGPDPEKPDRMCRVLVEDEGIGFDQKYLDRIFQPFQRLHGRAAFGGTGMGLAICRKVVARHGGSITARSAPGQGSCFVVSLPLRRGDGGAHPTGSDREGGPR